MISLDNLAVLYRTRGTQQEQKPTCNEKARTLVVPTVIACYRPPVVIHWKTWRRLWHIRGRVQSLHRPAHEWNHILALEVGLILLHGRRGPKLFRIAAKDVA